MLTVEARRQVATVVSRRPWSSRDWCDYFHRHRDDLLHIPWEQGSGLTDAERDLVAPSMQGFQQGESQEGGHFFRCARAYALAAGDPDYVEAHRLFMEEEKRHGRELARFLALAGVEPLREMSWLARGFCWCGSRGGFEPTLLVVLMGEVVALLYYTALLRATRSAVLRRLCAQLLRDEKQHLRFHSERLAVMRRGRGRAWLAMTHAFDAVLLGGAMLAAWCGHRRVLCAGGFGLLHYLRSGWRVFRSVSRQKDPRNYPSS